jgi:hypothetical protein
MLRIGILKVQGNYSLWALLVILKVGLPRPSRGRAIRSNMPPTYAYHPHPTQAPADTHRPLRFPLLSLTRMKTAGYPATTLKSEYLGQSALVVVSPTRAGIDSNYDFARSGL